MKPRVLHPPRRASVLVEILVTTTLVTVVLLGALGAMSSIGSRQRAGETRAYSNLMIDNIGTDLAAASRYDSNVPSHLASGTWTMSPEPIATPAGARYEPFIGQSTSVYVSTTTQNSVYGAELSYGPLPTPTPNGYNGPPASLVPTQVYFVPVYQQAPDPSPCPTAVSGVGFAC